MSVPTGLS